MTGLFNTCNTVLLHLFHILNDFYVNQEDQKPLPAAPPLASAAPQTFTGLLKYLQISTGSLKFPQISSGISHLVYISIAFAFL